MHRLAESPLPCPLLFLEVYFAQSGLEFDIEASYLPVSAIIKWQVKLIQVCNALSLLLLSHLDDLVLNG